jgi:hypothetical protein
LCLTLEGDATCRFACPIADIGARKMRLCRRLRSCIRIRIRIRARYIITS